MPSERLNLVFGAPETAGKMIKFFTERAQEKKLFNENTLRHNNKTEGTASPVPSAYTTDTIVGLDMTTITIRVPVARLQYHRYRINRSNLS